MGVFALLTLLIVWRISVLWFTRDSILNAAPDSTIFAVEFQITPKTWPIVKDFLENVPLVSNRSLDIEDIARFTHGDLAIFVTHDGTRAVAIRAKIESLPTDLLEAYGITIQEAGSGIILLSQTLLPIGGIDSEVHHSFLPSSSTWLGRVLIPDAGFSGSMIWKQRGLEMTFKTPKSNQTNANLIPPAILSMILSGRNKNELPPTSTYFEKQTTLFLDLLLKDHQIFVQKDEQEQTQILISVPNSGWDEAKLIEMLKIAGAYLSPKIVQKALVDGTFSQELSVEPDYVAVEEVPVAGHTLFRVTGEGGLALFGGFIDKATILSTSDSLITAFLDPQETTCGANLALLNPESLLEQVTITSYNPQYSLIINLFDQISAISFETKKYSNKVRFCSI